MSAFIVSAKHIATICNAVVYDPINQNIFSHWFDAIKKAAFFSDSVVGFEKQFIDEINEMPDTYVYKDNFEILAKILVNANNESVQYRYGDSSDEVKESLKYDQDAYLNQIYALSMHEDFGAKGLNFFQFLKLIHCLSYQSCEHPEWKNTMAYKFIEIAEMKAIYNAPEYQNHSWAI